MTFTPGEALSYGGWPEAEKTPNLLEELETWRKSSWEGEGSQQCGLHYLTTHWLRVNPEEDDPMPGRSQIPLHWPSFNPRCLLQFSLIPGAECQKCVPWDCLWASSIELRTSCALYQKVLKANFRIKKSSGRTKENRIYVKA